VDDNPSRRWSDDELMLIEQVTDQLTLALENAQLFEQTQHARDALQISVRYQKSVAEAVAVLSERGFTAISEVLQLLGQASQTSRAYYLETQVDHQGPYWRLVSEWHAPGVSSQLSNPALRRFSADWLKPWIQRLEKEGYLVETIGSASAEVRTFLESLGAQSILLFPVAGMHEAPGCIGFEQMEFERTWSDDEIAALQTAASALANTIVRENLFNQLQVNLSETEAQYQASAQLNSANNPEEILAILRQFTILGHMNASSVSINLFDHAWTRADRPQWLIPVTRWAADANQAAQSERYALREWKNAEAVLSPDRPTIVFDIASDPRIDASARSILRDATSAKSLLSVPLNVSGRWIGQIIALYSQTTGFTEREIRRLVSLSGQAAVAVESLRLLDETRQRNEELLAINQVTSAVSRTLEFKQVLSEILQRVLAITEFESGLISYVNPDTDTLTLAVQHELPIMIVDRLISQGLGGTTCDLVYSTGKTIYVPDMEHIPGEVLQLASLLDESWPHDGVAPAFAGHKALGFMSYLGVPLTAKGDQLGTVCVFSTTPRTVSAGRIALTEAIGQQVGVAVDNARLFQNTQIALGETEALYQASSELNSAQTYDDILQCLRRFTILGKTDKLLSISLFDHPWAVRTGRRKTGDLPALEGLKPPEWVIPIAHWTTLPSENMLLRYALSHFPAAQYLSPSEPTIVGDVETDSRLDYETRNLFLKYFQARSVIFVPLFLGNQWIGFLFGAFGIPAQFDEAQIRRLTALSSQAAIAIQNLRLLEESRRRASQLQTAAEIARDTSGTLALDILLQRSVSLITERFGFYHASIFLVDEVSHEAVVRESTGLAGEELKRLGHKLAIGGRSVIGQVTATGKSMVVNDVNVEEARSIHQPNQLLPLTRAELGIPLKIGERVIGALDVQSDRANAFSEDDIAVLQTLADQIAVAVDNARSYEVASQAVEDIREADRLKTQFLANMSHELRTPLNSIIGFSRVILKGIDGPINEQQAQDLTAIYTSGQHLLGLINDVLDLSRIEAGKMDLVLENDINLAEIIRSVMSTTVGLVKDKPIELKQVIEPELPLVTADVMKIRQVLINLLSNAAKFTENGTITVEAGKHSGPNGERQVIVKVIDTGAGIAEADQAKLFLPFSQVDGSLTRKTGGSGLGLSICNHLVDMHNGEIGLVSEVGKGSTFYFILPVTQPLVEEEINGQLDFEAETRKENALGFEETDLSAEEIDRSSSDAPRAAQPRSGPYLILAIERDHNVTELYKRYLANSDCAVISLTKLEQSVSAARGIQPFAITLDIAMSSGERLAGTGPLLNPRISREGGSILDGLKVLEELKSNPGTRQIPVIVCTMAAEQEKAFALGAADYLLKPILEEDLVRAIERLKAQDAG
jgi:GAF domain-containing protein/ActR/RegA family two-component response regulator